MKTPSVSVLVGVSVLLLMCGLTVSAVSLNVSPDRQQFFSGASVSLSCAGGHTGDGWTVKRTRGGRTEECGADHQDFGVFKHSSCDLDLFASYTGAYWCETSSGQTSDHVNISVHRTEEVAFILEIPALPVMAGSDVTLRCRNKDGSTQAAFFLRNNKVTGDKAKVQEFPISKVQQSDEGLYSCSTDASEPSPQSWLRVTDRPTTSDPHPPVDFTPPPSPELVPAPPPSLSGIRLLLHLLVFCPYFISTCVMLSIYYSRKTGNKTGVPMATTRRADECDDISAVVTTEHELRAAAQ